MNYKRPSAERHMFVAVIRVIVQESGENGGALMKLGHSPY